MASNIRFFNSNDTKQIYAQYKENTFECYECKDPLPGELVHYNYANDVVEWIIADNVLLANMNQYRTSAAIICFNNHMYYLSGKLLNAILAREIPEAKTDGNVLGQTHSVTEPEHVQTSKLTIQEETLEAVRQILSIAKRLELLYGEK